MDGGKSVSGMKVPLCGDTRCVVRHGLRLMRMSIERRTNKLLGLLRTDARLFVRKPAQSRPRRPALAPPDVRYASISDQSLQRRDWSRRAQKRSSVPCHSIGCRTPFGTRDLLGGEPPRPTGQRPAETMQRRCSVCSKLRLTQTLMGVLREAAQVHSPLASYIPRLLPSSSDRDTAILDGICTRGFRGTQIGRDLGR
jgi:hypothetical protein